MPRRRGALGRLAGDSGERAASINDACDVSSARGVSQQYHGMCGMILRVRRLSVRFTFARCPGVA
jgi:hypothetical protein